MRYITLLFITMICCDARYIPENGVYSVAEKMPVYEGGMESFEQHIRNYTDSISEDYSSGTVFVSFIVSANGKLREVKVLNSLSKHQDSIALEIIKNAPSDWEPGIYDGNPVDVKMTYPIRF